MANDRLLHRAIERFWDCVPPVWGIVRDHARSTAVRDHEISLVQFHILRHIAKGTQLASELAERLQISRPAISQALELLVDDGFVVQREDPHDRRFIQLELTEAGSRLLNAIFGENRQWMEGRMAGLSPEELETIIHALDILKNTFIAPED
jgi:DNA-binding MarR family transcriptional regulator